MGCSQTKEKSTPSDQEKMVEGLESKIRLLQGEINEMMSIREGESEIYERELMVFAIKQEEWKREKHKLKGEVKKLGKSLQEKEEKLMRCMENNNCCYEKNELANLSTKCVMEQIEVEKNRRDETVEKWKQLYFAIKVELDDLIQRTTHQEERICWGAWEEATIVVAELKKEVRAKEEKIEILQQKLASMENQELKREREMDILRQSLRIMSHKRKSTKFDRVDHNSRN